MATISITGFTLPDYNYAGATAKLRLYASRDFTDSNGVPHLKGNVGSSAGFYQEVDCTIVDGELVIPTFSTPSTTDSLPVSAAPSVFITAVIFDAKSARRESLFSQWRIPSTPTPTTWTALMTYNISRTLPQAPSYYLSAQDVQTLIDAQVGSLNKANVSPGYGITALSVAPVSVSNPIAVGDNDPRLLAATIYASLAAAVTAIGSTLTTLVVSTADFPSGASTTVPATLILDFRGPGSLLLTTGHVVTVVSDPSSWPKKKLFGNALSGQGTVAFTGNKSVAKLDPRWWGAVIDDVTNDQGAWDAVLAAAKPMRVATVIVPRGTSIVTALTLPTNTYANNDGFSITLEGQSGPPPIEYGTIAGAPHLITSNSSIIKSTTAGAVGLINGSENGNIMAVELTLRNVVIRREASPAGPGINGDFFGGLHLDNVAVDASQKTTDVATEPTTAGAYGIIWPRNANSASQSIRGNTFVQGFTTAMKAGEHLTQTGQLTLSACGVGIEFILSGHTMYFDRINAMNMPRVLKFTGSAHVTIQQLNIEHANIGANPVPAWQETVYDIDDASNHGRGRIDWMVIRSADSGTIPPLIRNGGKYIRYLHLRYVIQTALEATRTANQAITTGGAGAAISWTTQRTEADFPGASFPFTVYTIPISGMYDIDVHVTFEESTSGTFIVSLLKGGTIIARDIKVGLGASYTVPLNAHRTIYLEQGDLISVVVFHDYGSNRDIVIPFGSNFSPSLTVALR